MRTSAGPDVLYRGVEAVYWNPAAIYTRTFRGEAMITDQRTPEAIGVGGFSAALAWKLDARTTIAAGYQRVSIDDIGETSESPLPDPGIPATFSIGEDQVSVGAAHIVGTVLTVGAGVRYDRSDETGVAESTTSLTAGLLVVPTFAAVQRFAPTAGASIVAHRDGVRWSGGLDFALPLVSDFETRIGYGARGGEGLVDFEHRIGVTAIWRSLASATIGAMNGGSGGDTAWELTFGGALRFRRYELGVLREALANDFGAAYAFRLRVGIN